MKTGVLNKHNILSGIVGGLVAGVLLGCLMARMGVLSYAGRFFNLSDPLSSFIINLVFSGILGVIFALLFYHACKTFYSSALWGIGYSIIWWLIGPMILCPWMRGVPISWASGEMCQAFPMLIGHLVFGIVLGAIYFWMRTRK